MRLEGRRIHIAGSANAATPDDKLLYAHRIVEDMVAALAQRGARFLVGAGKEPRASGGDPLAQSLVFDWTVMAVLHGLLHQGAVRAIGPFGRVITTVATGKTQDQVPDDRSQVWRDLRDSDAVQLDFMLPGWASGAVRRERQARLGDVLIALSGGEGVEHLAQLYARAGKPVITLDLNLGSSTNDGSGGAARLAARALANPAQFVRLKAPEAGGALLADLATMQGARPLPNIVAALLRLLDALVEPNAFYVRLLNPDAAEYGAVERFFRQVVDPVVREFGYNAVEMGCNPVTQAWMNQEIFENLHYSQLVIADLTGGRPNCFMELGYALRGQSAVLLTAMAGSQVPFDAQMLEYYPWDDATADEVRQAKFRDYWRRTIDRPSLVRERDVL